MFILVKNWIVESADQTPSEYGRLLERHAGPCGIEDSSEDVTIEGDYRETISRAADREQEGRAVAFVEEVRRVLK